MAAASAILGADGGFAATRASRPRWKADFRKAARKSAGTSGAASRAPAPASHSGGGAASPSYRGRATAGGAEGTSAAHAAPEKKAPGPSSSAGMTCLPDSLDLATGGSHAAPSNSEQRPSSPLVGVTQTLGRAPAAAMVECAPHEHDPEKRVPPHIRTLPRLGLPPDEPAVLVALPWSSGGLFLEVPCRGASCGAGLKDAVAREVNLPKLFRKHLELRRLPGPAAPQERDVALLDGLKGAWTLAMPRGYFPEKVLDRDPFPDPSRSLGPGSFIVAAIEPEWSWRLMAADIAAGWGFPVYEPWYDRRYGS
ncbi:hypothetical protein DFJ74DRAFT_742937 [Hyaloraphidium curvatum]|nr:hypothetical protein DFJ74DRAFT_742937 [Hyaloraphidium curvatum]